jgi:hypothetical protein
MLRREVRRYKRSGHGPRTPMAPHRAHPGTPDADRHARTPQGLDARSVHDVAVARRAVRDASARSDIADEPKRTRHPRAAGDLEWSGKKEEGA